MTTKADLLFNVLGGLFRPRGISVRHAAAQPPKLLKLYDIEASPYCRMVREVLTELDLDVLIQPCPSGGTRFRPEAQRIGGKQLFPLLVDENTNTTLYESADIIDYLRRTYAGLGPQPRGWRRVVAVGTSILSSLTLLRLRGLVGLKARPSREPAKPLALYSFEFSPFSKTVRAELCELELPYILRNTGKGHWKDMGTAVVRDKLWKAPMGTTRNRRWLEQNTGRVQVPYLIDPNTGTAMYESADILRYLRKTYAL
jgi:glutathione S-transferase